MNANNECEIVCKGLTNLIDNEREIKEGIDLHVANGNVSLSVSPINESIVVPPMVTVKAATTTGVEPQGATRLFFFRYVVLALFVAHSMTNSFQWIQYSIIANVVTYYYGVESIAVDWTSMIYMFLYIPLVFPASWLLERKGLRYIVLMGSFGTALGALVKCASVAPDRFYVTMIGQGIVAASQMFILGIPPRLAAVWFGPNEVSSACAVGVFGNQFGIALGFLLPPELVRSSNDKDRIGSGLQTMFYAMAAITSIIFILIVFFFRDKPPCPPSPAAAAAAAATSQGLDGKGGTEGNYVKSIQRLLANKSYVLLLVSYGINVGVFYAISTLLNQVVLDYFPGEERNAGRIGLSIVLSGMLGSVVCGLWLDKTHKFKETTLAVYICSLLGMLIFTFQFKLHQISAVFVAAASLGFFMTGYLPLGFEFAAEITYPESEGTSSGLLNASAQVFGISFTLLTGWMLTRVGDVTANLVLCVALVVGVFMTGFVKSELKRQAAQNKTPTSKCSKDTEFGV